MAGSFIFTPNTPTVPVTGARSFAPAPINFDADFRVVDDKPGEVILTNITAPVDQPETIRVASAEIADVFKGSQLDRPDPGLGGGPVIRGRSVLVQLNSSCEVSSGFTMPFSAHLVLKVPNEGAANEDDIKTLIERLLGTLYDTKATTIGTRISAMLRGAVTPLGL